MYKHASSMVCYSKYVCRIQLHRRLSLATPELIPCNPENNLQILSLFFPTRKSIPAGEEFSHVFKLKARRSGSKEIMVNFTADQLSGLTGSAEVYISYGE